MKVPLRALTLKQPWAALVASGAKPVENRTWRPPASLIGERLGIHAGLAVDEEAMARWPDAPGVDIAGAVVAIVTVSGAVRDSSSPWAEQGYWHWLLVDVEVLDPPVPARGYPGLWAWTSRP